MRHAPYDAMREAQQFAQEIGADDVSIESLPHVDVVRVRAASRRVWFTVEVSRFATVRFSIEHLRLKVQDHRDRGKRWRALRGKRRAMLAQGRMMR